MRARAAALALALLIFPLLAPSPARAVNECGTLSSTVTTATCSGQTYGSGIRYTWNPNVRTVSVPGHASGTTITSQATSGWASGISVENHTSSTVGITLTVGSSNAVSIVQTTSGSGRNAGSDGHGIVMGNRAAAGDVTVNIGGTGAVNIGSSTTSMEKRGFMLWMNTGNAITITSAANIWSTDDGIHVERNSAADTTSATAITNSGAIRTTSGDGIELNYGAPTGGSANNGGATITNSGALTLGGGGYGVRAVYRGYGAVRIENQAAVTSSATGGRGIDLWVDKADSTAASTIINSGAVTAHSRGIRVQHKPTGALAITNSGALSVSNGLGIDVASHTSTTGGGITIANSAAITTPANVAIWAAIRGKDGAGANAGVSVTHSAGAIQAGGGSNGGIVVEVGSNRQEANAMHASYVAPVNAGLAKVAVTGGSVQAPGVALRVLQYEAGSIDVDVSSGVTVTSTAEVGIWAALTDVGNSAGGIDINSAGTLTAAKRGIYAGRASSTGTGAISVVNSGSLTASTAANTTWPAIEVNDAGAGAVSVTNSGTITGPGYSIHVQNSGGGGVTIANSAALIASAQAAIGINVVQNNGGVAITRQSALIRAGQRGISVTRAAGSGAVSIVNSGDIEGYDAAGRRWEAIRVQDEGSGSVSITNSGALGGAGAKAFWYGIRVDHRGAGVSASVTIANSGDITASTQRAIFAKTTGKDSSGANAGVSVTHSAGAISVGGSNSRAIQVEVGSSRKEADAMHANYVAPVNAGLARVAVTGGSVQSPGVALSVLQYEAGSIDVDVSSGATVTSTADVGIWAALTDVGNAAGGIDINNAGTLIAAKRGIHAGRASPAGTGAISVVNSGSVTASRAANTAWAGIEVLDEGRGSVSVANSGDITTTGAGISARKNGSAGAVSVAHSAGDIAAGAGAGIHASNGYHDNAAAVTVSVTGGSVTSEGQGRPAVEVFQRGTGDAVANVGSGAALTSRHDAGVHASLDSTGNAAGRIRIAQGGTIAGRSGVQAEAWRASEEGETRAASAQPLIDVAWTGSFSHGTAAAVAQSDADRFAAFSAANAIAVHRREVETGRITRYGRAAGVEARALSWEDAAEEAAKGDDPGAIATMAAQTALLAASGAASRRAAILGAFKAALGSEEVEVAAEVFDAIKTGAESLADVTDAEIAAYLETDDADTRTLLRNVLAGSLSEKEKAVLRAVVTNTGLDAALNDADAGFTSAYKTAVRALLDRFNIGDIRVAVNGGSIDSRGDGVRAYYATPHEDNGGIEVTVAQGAVVTGAMAGIYAANAGSGEGGILNQRVTVHGTVTGGSDSAVHLAGGGRLTVGQTGKAYAGASGVAVLVNEPGPAVIVVHGEVRGGAGPTDSPAPAAVHLTGGGSVTIGLTGSVDANGAAAAIRGDEETALTIHAPSLDPETIRAAVGERLMGAIVGEGAPASVTIAEANPATGMTTGETTTLPLVRGAEGMPPELELPDAPDAPATAFRCGMAMDRRCELYEALPSLLLAASRPPSFAGRAAVPRGVDGAWGRVETARGEWTADRAASKKSLSYDYDLTGGRAGVDFAGGAGVSFHILKAKAKMSGVGEISLNGMGAGASGAWTLEDFRLSASGQLTKFDADIDSSRVGGLKRDAGGSGVSLGVELARRKPVMVGAFALTPRAGLDFASAKLGRFTDSEAVNGTRVRVEDARSFRGRLGATLEKPMEKGGALFGTLDLEQEFSDETSVKISDLRLRTEAPATALRLGAGGAFEPWEGVTLGGRLHYAAGGSGVRRYGLALSLGMRF